MKTLLKRSVSLWLSLAVLLGSVGLTVSEHICLISGKVMLSYEHKEDPCKAHGETDCEKPAEKPVAKAAKSATETPKPKAAPKKAPAAPKAPKVNTPKNPSRAG